MLTSEDLEAMGYSEYMRERARLYCMTPLSMAKEFAKVMGQPKNPGMSACLIQEEYEEWEKAYDWDGERGEVEELKELADLVYVIYGYANAMGWDLDEALRRVHANNLRRCVWPDGSVKYREDGKVMKNPDAPAINLSDLVE
jgi:NTP pyrophosphatase (non-canonical NTP hydrolase)